MKATQLGEKLAGAEQTIEIESELLVCCVACAGVLLLGCAYCQNDDKADIIIK